MAPARSRYLHHEWLLRHVLAFLEDDGDDVHMLFLLALDRDLAELRAGLEQHCVVSIARARQLAVLHSQWSALLQLTRPSRGTRRINHGKLQVETVDRILSELDRAKLPDHPDRRNALLDAVASAHRVAPVNGSCRSCGYCSGYCSCSTSHFCTTARHARGLTLCVKSLYPLMNAAARLGNLESVIFLHHVACYDQPVALKLAGENGHTSVVSWLLDHPHDGVRVDSRLQDEDSLDGIIAWCVGTNLQGRRSRTYYTMSEQYGFHASKAFYSLEGLGASDGDVGILRKFLTKPCITVDDVNAVALSAGSSGNRPVLHYLRDEHVSLFSSNGILQAAVANGQLDVAQWLVVNHYGVIDQRTICSAVSGGHLPLLQWALAGVSTPSAYDKNIECTTFDGTSLPILRWLVSHRGLELTPLAHARMAIRRNDTELTKWVVRQSIANGVVTHSVELIHLAIRAHNDELVRFFVEEIGVWNAPLLNVAAGCGSCETFGFLYGEARRRSAATHIRSRSARCDIVEWLVRHGEQDSHIVDDDLCAMLMQKPDALCLIIDTFDPDYVKRIPWLPKWAAQHGRQATLERLAEIGHENLFTRKLFDRLLVHSRKESVIQWFLQHRPQLYTTLVVRWAATHGKRGLLTWIFQAFLPSYTPQPGINASLLLFKSLRTALWTAARHDRGDLIALLMKVTNAARDISLWHGINRNYQPEDMLKPATTG